MPEKILAILPSDFDLGFKLTGVDTRGCTSLEEARGCLEKELLLARYGLIIIDEQFLMSSDSRLNKKIRDSMKPLVMAIPLKRDFKKEPDAKDYFLKMVQSAIGYEIRIR